MAKESYVCVLCQHEFESEELPKRCPDCLARDGVERLGPAKRAAIEGGAGGSRVGLLAAAVAFVVIAGAVAAFFLTDRGGGGSDEPASGAPSGGATSPGGSATPAPVDPGVAPDPTEAGEALTALAGAQVAGGTAEEKRTALLGYLVGRVKAGKLRRHDREQAFERAPLRADQIATRLSAGSVPPLVSLEVASFVSALGRAAGLEGVVVEETDAPNSATSLTRKRFAAQVGGVVVDPWAADGRAGEAKRAPVDPRIVRAYFQGLGALAAAEQEDFKQANEKVALALKLAPEEPALIFLKGQVTVLSGMVQFGIEDLERALARREDALGRYNLGVAYVQAQRFFKANESLRRAIELDPKFAGAWLALANLYLARISLSPATEREGLVRSAQEAIEKARAVDPDAEGIAPLSAQVLLAQDDERGALTVLDDAVRAHPERPHAYLLLGALLANKGSWAELVAYLKKGWKHNPDNAEIRGMLVMGYLQQGRLDEAEKILIEALAANPGQPDVRVELAGLMAQRGDGNAAHRLLEEELQRFPESDKAALLLAEIDLNANDLEKAAERADAVLARQPTLFEALALRYIVAVRQEAKTDAAALLNRVATARPNGRTVLAHLLLGEGLVEEAAAVLEVVVRDRPGSVAETVMLVGAYTAAGRDADAGRVADGALAAVPDEHRAELQRNIAMVQVEARRARAAMEAAEHAPGPEASPETAPASPPDESPEDGAETATPVPGPPSGGAMPLAPSIGGSGLPSVRMPLIRMPSAPGEERDRGLPGPGPGLELPDLPTAP